MDATGRLSEPFQAVAASCGEDRKGEGAIAAAFIQSLSKSALETDAHWLEIAQKTLPEAVLKDNPITCVFNTKGGVKLTVVKQASIPITFDIDRRLSIDGQPQVCYTADDCYIHFYELEGHPDFICVDEKDVDKDPVRNFWFRAWKPVNTETQTLVEKQYCSRNLAKLRFWEEKVVVDMTEFGGNPLIKKLLKLISPYAVMTHSARYQIYNDNENQKQIFLLNLTAHKLEIRPPSKELYLNERKLGTLIWSQAMVAYHVSDSATIFCIDSLGAREQLRNRLFVDISTCAFKGFHIPFSPCPSPQLLATPNSFRQNEGEKLSSEELACWKADQEFILMNNPHASLKVQISRHQVSEAKTVTMFNHTDAEAWIDTDDWLVINGVVLHRLSPAEDIITLYHRQKGEKISMVASVSKGRCKCVTSKSFGSIQSPPTYKVVEVRMEIALERIFRTIWAARQDADSAFFAHKFTKDMTAHILLIYFKLISSAFTRAIS